MTITVMAAETLGIHDCHDTLHEALWDREGDRRTADCVLGTEEVWNYDAVTAGWYAYVRDQLAPHGIRFDVDEDEVVLSATVTTDRARELCAEVLGRLATWLDAVVSEVREESRILRCGMHAPTPIREDAGSAWPRTEGSHAGAPGRPGPRGHRAGPATGAAYGAGQRRPGPCELRDRDRPGGYH
ncbi:hypothetical protein [Streptomyces sp. NBC_01601]|uniref:hypothetical protein n=1 Tax=Streptomyces sp. NBC_01601 TaxID=2975892 RepID=UPI002E29D2F9|nr:hypothetical protein [Streptomyces sp. NBC_01601]